MPEPNLTETPTWLAGLLGLLSALGGWFARRPRAASESIAPDRLAKIEASLISMGSRVLEVHEALCVEDQNGVTLVTRLVRVHDFLTAPGPDDTRVNRLRELQEATVREWQSVASQLTSVAATQTTLLQGIQQEQAALRQIVEELARRGGA